MSIGNELFHPRKRLGSFAVERDRSLYQIDCKGGRTKQEFAEECDLNVLMRRYEKTGVLPSGRMSPPRYVDAFDLPSYQESMQIMADAERAFMALPARIRGEFDNDPEKFVAFAQDENNVEKLREWGLAKPVEAAPEPVEVKVVNSPEPRSEGA